MDVTSGSLLPVTASGVETCLFAKHCSQEVPSECLQLPRALNWMTRGLGAVRGGKDFSRPRSYAGILNVAVDGLRVDWE